MFTGIITAIGQITHIENLGTSAAHGKRLTIQTPEGYLDDVALGDSIALNGACMTVTALSLDNSAFTIEISAESLRLTTGLDQLQQVNLEKALRAADRLGGHIVSGHVDGIGTVSHFSPVGESHELRIQAPKALAQYLAYKGSITVQGVSLTVNAVTDLTDSCEFSINLIAHTVEHTTFKHLRVGSHVNLEIDVIARYVARMLAMPQID
ncbi:riboflavin synthase [Lampropedia puyangensis]|uniref:Riboflavin synthase n=1 Tax=Lampropedia puyangensis TaxID=1330072 RepID=A0A4S8F7S2_9BURK|nr:riboflavin synthase [Lampropedia puyangensis]THU03658.1 riboflavin synthase [Lampropedia puyangensis]